MMCFLQSGGVILFSSIPLIVTLPSVNFMGLNAIA